MRFKKAEKKLNDRLTIRIGKQDSDLRAAIDELIEAGAEPSWIVKEALRIALPEIRAEVSDMAERSAAGLRTKKGPANLPQTGPRAQNPVEIQKPHLNSSPKKQ